MSCLVDFRLVTRGLGNEIESILNENPIRVYLISAFITHGGAKKVVEWADSCRTAEFRLITGTYLDFTDPEALVLLRGNDIPFRIVDKRSENLHAKAYLFVFEDRSTLIIGSANLTRSALYDNVEWSGYISQGDLRSFDDFIQEFNKLWEEGSNLSDSWLDIYRNEYRRSNAVLRSRDDSDRVRPTPRLPQEEALSALQDLRDIGETKGLVVMATGLGKTHLAAFDSEPYSKVLFIAHRKEILIQAKGIFEAVRGSGEILLFEDGWWTKDRADVLLATVQKIGRPKTLHQFSPSDFNYIVVDEFHHAKATQYKRILDYFDPMFLLGLTATPFRMDRQDITELCDYNIPYSTTFVEGIGRRWLSPFHYYGIYDDSINYSEIPWKRNRYDPESLLVVATREERSRKILDKYREYRNTPTVAFCISIAHADYMCRYFNEHGIPSLAVHSNGATTSEGKKRVQSGEIEVIFAVDVFNEGVDLPEISTVMFLRPTESLTIFIQQLGRGLRLSGNKEYLTVLDFVGNYKKSFTIPTLLMGTVYPHLSPEGYKIYIERISDGKIDLPEGCQVHFDLELIDLMEKSLGVLHPVRYALTKEYMSLKSMLGTVPISTLVSHSKSIWNYIHTFGSLYDFYKGIGDLNEEQQGYTKMETDLLRWVERKEFESDIPLQIIGEILTEERQYYLDEIEEMVDGYLLEDDLPHDPVDLHAAIQSWISPTKFNSRKIHSTIEIVDDLIVKSSQIRWGILHEDIMERINLRIRYSRTTFSTFENYSMEEIFKILKRKYPEGNFSSLKSSFRSGIERFDDQRLMLLFVTLDKNEKDHEKTMYEDHLLSRSVFEWESQNKTRLSSIDGRVITGEMDYDLLLFVRLKGKDRVYGNSHFYMGKVSCISHEGEKPIKVRWQLEEEVPPALYSLFTDKVYRKYKMPKQTDFDLDAEV